MLKLISASKNWDGLFPSATTSNQVSRTLSLLALSYTQPRSKIVAAGLKNELKHAERELRFL
jgi:hypothetical protein